MPKRIPTPPPGDDEPRYLTVVHPYAISGTCNMELPKDRQDFARWVACCINKDAFFAIFHKPSSRGMVIIEITRDYPHFDRILGEHRWSEFLHKPSKDEKGRLTKVFYCSYNTGRIVQKNGWKRIDVDEAWFKGWAPNNKQIKFPYPQTHFCDVPVEDRTNHPLCRPLPGAVKTPPPVEEIAAPQPVVGSAAWIQSKGGDTVQDKSNPLGAWGKGAPKAQATSAPPKPTASANVKKPIGIPAPSTGARMPAVGGGPIAVKASNVWQHTGKKPAPVPVATNWDESRQGTPVSGTVSPATVSTAPPGLPAQRNAWASGATSYPSHPPGLAVPSNSASVAGRPGNASATGWDSTGGASASSPDSDFGPDLTTATESDNPYAVHINFSESMEEEFHGAGIKAMDDDDDDDDGLRELDSIAPGNWDGPGMGAWDTAAVDGWDMDPSDAADLWQKNQEAVEPVLCSAHGVICRKGICAEYAKQLRQIKWAKEAEERRAAIANKGKKGNRRNRGAGKKKNDENEDGNEAGGRTMQNNPFRGPGAPVKMNWRGAPRTIVSADVVEKREAAKASSDDGWGDSDSEHEPNAGAVVAAGTTDAASDASWDVSEDAFDPWAATPQPVAKANANRFVVKPQGKKKPEQAKPPPSFNWADQVEAEFAAGKGGDTVSQVSSKRGSKRGTSTTSKAGTAKTAASTAGSSTSGWGSVPEMPW